MKQWRYQRDEGEFLFETKNYFIRKELELRDEIEKIPDHPQAQDMIFYTNETPKKIRFLHRIELKKMLLLDGRIIFADDFSFIGDAENND